MFCINCGNKLVAQAKFCANCGSQRVSNKSAKNEAEMEMAVAPSSPPASELKRRTGPKSSHGTDGQEKVQEVLESRPTSLGTNAPGALSMSSGREWQESTERVFYSGLMGKVTEDVCSIINNEEDGQSLIVMMVRDISEVKLEISHIGPSQSRSCGRYFYVSLAVMLIVSPIIFGSRFPNLFSSIIFFSGFPHDSFMRLPYFGDAAPILLCLSVTTFLIAVGENIFLPKRVVLEFSHLGARKSFRVFGWRFGNGGAEYLGLIELGEALIKSFEESRSKIGFTG